MIRFCQICHKVSHVANECWELTKNAEKRPVGWQTEMDKLQDKWDTLDASATMEDTEEGAVDL